jgi:hypothetical protein
MTRAQAEGRLIRRLGRQLTFWGLDGTTVDGSNADVGEALARALEAMGTPPADATAVTDADLSGVAADARLLDLAHLYLLEACLDNADVVRERQGVNEQEWNGRLRELRERYEQKRAEVAETHGQGAAVASIGTITLGFAEPEPDPDDDEALD